MKLRVLAGAALTLVSATSSAGCLIDRSGIAGSPGIDAFLEHDTGVLVDGGVPLDARADAFVGMDAALDAFSPLDGGPDAPIVPDAGVDAAVMLDAPPIDAFTPFDAWAPDAFAPPDAFVTPDAFVQPDAFTPDAFVVPDAFVPDAFVVPDAYRIPDAFVAPDAYSFSDLVAWYPFSSTTDVTGHGHDLSNSGVAFADPIATFGGGDTLTTPDAPDLDQILSLALWARPDMRRGNRMGLVDREGSWGIFIQPAGTVECNIYGSTRILSAAIPLDTWTHVACVFDAGTVRLYVGGTEVASTMTGTMAAGSSRVQIGQNCCDGADEFRGDLSDVRFYRRVLTDGDVGTLSADPPP